MENRMNGQDIIRQCLQQVFNIPENTVNSFLEQLSASGEMELVSQRISNLPVDVLDQINAIIGYSTNDTSVDNLEIGNSDNEQVQQMYADNFDSSKEDEELHDEPDYEVVKSLLNRLTSNGDQNECQCGSLREFISNKLHEMNDVDVEQTITNDTTDGIDPATMRRIQALRDSGNNEAADRLLQQATRRKIVGRNQRPKTPLDNTIKAQKRQLANTIRRRNAAQPQSDV